MHADKPISGDIIKKGFDKFDFLGPSIRASIFEDMARHEITLDSAHHYSLKEIEKYLTTIVGEDAALLLIARLQCTIHSLKSFVAVSIPTAALAFSCTSAICACAICEFICNCANSMAM